MKNDTRDIQSAAIVWFRRDLRDYDHAALAAALAGSAFVHGVFVFDTEILERLVRRDDPRVTFIWESVCELQAALGSRGIALHVVHGRAREVVPSLAAKLDVRAVFTNRDYEPEALARDEEVRQRLEVQGCVLRTFKDQVLFEANEVRTQGGGMFSVFTPYKRAWLAKLDASAVSPHGCARAMQSPEVASSLPSLESIGFARRDPAVAPGMAAGRAAWISFRERLARYAEERDFPALQATSGLSVHLRFGTVSVRELASEAMRRDNEGARTWLSELAWRDFFFAILASRPDVVDHAFNSRFDALEWENDKSDLAAWREGQTGFPIVDAAMRELSAQGTLHNRLRMVAASFLVKDLGIDWRLGERHFAATLLDYDLAANNGNWQWCASTGCDAQPWFRIFNPVTQSKRFDPEGAHIRRWMPELERVDARRIHAPWEMTKAEQEACGCRIGREYPAPIVSHLKARAATLERYGAVKGGVG